MDPVTQQSDLERSDTRLSRSQVRAAAGRDSSDPRPSAPTLAVAGASELARNIDRVQEQIERESSGSPASGQLTTGDSRHPEWCVDFGSVLKPMTTFELWIAVASGSVTPETRVWRDGMECWRRVRSVPELAHVLPDLPGRGAAANDATQTPPPTVSKRSPSEITPRTPVRANVASELDADERTSGIPAGRGTALYQSGFFSVAIGAAVGLGALLFALISMQGARPPGRLAALFPAAPRAMQGISLYARSLYARALTAGTPEQAAGTAAEVEPELSDQELLSAGLDSGAHRSSLSARHRDPGQRRARRGSMP